MNPTSFFSDNRACDELGRLTSEVLPEWGPPTGSSGTTTYQYDSNSNLTSKTDARGTISTYAYDQLNRVTSATFTGGTPSHTYSYDSTGVTYGIGRRTQMIDGGGTKTYDYDKMGRIYRIVWQTASFTQTGEFVYNYLGGMLESRWPGILDGPTPLTIYKGFDASGKAVSSNWSNGGSANQPLVTNHTYDYLGSSDTTWAEERTVLPNSSTEVITYNSRLQPRQRRLENPSIVNLDYNFLSGSSKNNGNVWGITETSPGITNRNTTYTYDWINRLKTAVNTGGWGLSYTFDRYGNRLTQSATAGTPPVKTLAYTAARNRISTTGHTYDDAGNLTAEPGFSYQYDANNLMKTATIGAATGTYVYDGDGLRVKRTGSGETRWYFYDPSGDPVWEWKGGVWESFNLYFNGKHLAVNNTTEGLRWRHQDHLGSLRVKTNSSGAVTCRYWFYPYGEAWTNSCNEGDKRLFTDKLRDPETGLDYFGARYYASNQGRFTSVDPAQESGRFEDPQTWNRFAYVANRPLHFVDPDGREPISITNPGAGLTPNEGPSGPGLALRIREAALQVVDAVSKDHADRLILGTMVMAIMPESDGELALSMIPGGKMGSGILKGADDALGALTSTSKAAKGRSLADQAADLVPANGGKTRVTLQSPSQQMRVDLTGKSHAGVPTPHTKVSPRNPRGPNQPAYNTRKAPVKPATQQDIRTVRRYLEKEKKN